MLETSSTGQLKGTQVTSSPSWQVQEEEQFLMEDDRSGYHYLNLPINYQKWIIRYCVPPVEKQYELYYTNYEVFLSKKLNLNLIKPLEQTSIYGKYKATERHIK